MWATERRAIIITQQWFLPLHVWEEETSLCNVFLLNHRSMNFNLLENKNTKTLMIKIPIKAANLKISQQKTTKAFDWLLLYKVSELPLKLYQRMVVMISLSRGIVGRHVNEIHFFYQVLPRVVFCGFSRIRRTSMRRTSNHSFSYLISNR